jgi:hypothetical protein
LCFEDRERTSKIRKIEQTLSCQSVTCWRECWDISAARNAAVIGRVTDQHHGMLVARTAIGGTRVIPVQIGALIPLIC